MSLKDRILAAQDIPVRMVEVPEWGVTVEVRGMDGGGRADMLEQAMADDGEINLREIYPDMVIFCTFDPETGIRVFEPGDREALLTKSAAAMDRVAKVAMSLSGFDDDAVDTAGKGSSSDRN